MDITPSTTETIPSLCITQASVLTSNPEQPVAQAVALAGNRIMAVGTNEEILALKRPGTRLVDAQGCTLMPGFIDCHVHLLIGSAELDNIFLDDILTLDDLTAKIRKHAQSHPQVEWICGSHMKYAILPGDEPLTRHHLDAILSDQPLVLMAYDYHTVWANTQALARGGVLQGFDPGPTGVLVMGKDGLASGELREAAAYKPVLAKAGSWGRITSGLTSDQPFQSFPEEDLQVLRKGISFLARHGITSIHNMDGNLAQLGLYTALENAGELNLRISFPISINPSTKASLIEEVVHEGRKCQTDVLRFEAAKFFMDGVIESGTAFLLDDYVSLPGQQGHPYYSLEQFISTAALCDQLGLQIRVHAIGDAAIRHTLDGYEAIRKMNGPRDSRHRIEHIELLHPSDQVRFAQLGVIASMQPLHLAGSNFADDIWLKQVGQSRWDRGFSWQSLRNAGARLVFGSDWPVVSPNPMLGLDRAINRRSWADGLTPQKQSLRDCLASYTRDAAYAEFQEDHKGQLRPGFLADMVLLSANLESIPSAEISHVTPVLTIFNGQVTYES